MKYSLKKMYLDGLIEIKLGCISCWTFDETQNRSSR